MKNLMTADTDLAKLTIFDYNVTTGGGNSAHTHRHTLIAMESESLQIPQFSIRPEGFWDKISAKIGAKIGFQDINFLKLVTFVSRTEAVCAFKALRQSLT
jgi:hypothetical protein